MWISFPFFGHVRLGFFSWWLVLPALFLYLCVLAVFALAYVAVAALVLLGRAVDSGVGRA